jgi:hypothetical protein
MLVSNVRAAEVIPRCAGSSHSVDLVTVVLDIENHSDQIAV